MARILMPTPSSVTPFYKRITQGFVQGQALTIMTGSRHGKSQLRRREILMEAALTFYHSEVPIEDALRYLAKLSNKV